MWWAKSRKRIEAGGQALDVGRRPAADCPQHRRAARLGNHRFGIALAQRQSAERKVARDFDRDPAHAERQCQPEIRIARDACEYLDPVRDEFLHQESGI